jgi:aldehyde:ferredoxin oxidoreductase
MPANHGRFYRVDLGQGRLRQQAIDADILREYIGGVGLAARLLLDESIEADALLPEAPMAIAFSPLVGSPMTTSAKFAFVARSPLTGRFNDSLVSSGFALAGKRTGADAIVLVGKATSPSVLLIDNGACRLDAAGDLWGCECSQAEAELKSRYGSDWRFAVIGPAGERQVLYASVSHDGRHAARGGHGALLGAKNIKAIGVRGDKTVEWSAPGDLVKLAKDFSHRSFGPATAKYRELGTAANLLAFNRLNCLPTENFQKGAIDGVESLAPEALSAAHEKTRSSCAACTIGCEHIYRLDANRNVRVEYENLFALGPLCGITQSSTVLRASNRCDALGIDTISCGGSIAFAMECVQRGLLDEPWLRFGDGEALLRAIELIAARVGVGDLLATGVRNMSSVIGGNSASFAAHVKGLEMPGYEPRGAQTLALGMAVGARGADHNRSGAYEVDFSEVGDRRRLVPESARWAVESEDRAAIMDSLILCKFIRRTMHDFYAEAAQMLRLATGFDYQAEELKSAANTIVAAKKRFNQRVGWTRDEDTLPPRFLDSALPNDPQAIIDSKQLEAAIDDYYALRGWSREGRI